MGQCCVKSDPKDEDEVTHQSPGKQGWDESKEITTTPIEDKKIGLKSDAESSDDNMSCHSGLGKPTSARKLSLGLISIGSLADGDDENEDYFGVLPSSPPPLPPPLS